MAFDWTQLLELAPLALAKPGSPQAAALMQGYLQSKQRIEQQQRQQGLDMRQGEYQQAQMANMERDDARAEAALALERVKASMAAGQGAVAALQDKPETLLPAGVSPLEAQNALVVDQFRTQRQLGVPAGTPQTPLPNMMALVSEGKRRRAKQWADQFDKEYGEHAQEASTSFRVAPGGEFAGMTPAEIRAMGTSVPTAPRRKKGDFEEYRNAPPEEQALILRQRKEYQQADDRDRVARFQSKEVLNDQGQPVVANFDAVTGIHTDPSGQRIVNPRPVPSASATEAAGKFAKAKPVLRAVAELSERINTLRGVVAKVRGGIEKAKAQANLNDDVAEYEALIAGFTPMVARALGHTGVLTQQDVDSVRALFPTPGDSKNVRDRKVGRVLSIIGELEGASAAAGAKAETSGRTRVIGPSGETGTVPAGTPLPPGWRAAQ